MGAPITSFEIIESIRFFAQLVGTDGISEVAQKTANSYIERLLEALESGIREATASSAGIKLIN